MHCSKWLVLLLIIGLPLASNEAAYAQAADNDVVHDNYGNVTRNSFGNCVETRWPTAENSCQLQQAAVQEPPPRPLSPTRTLQKEQRTVYFEFNKAELIETERHKLDSLAEVLKSDNELRSAKIAGYADRIGSEAYNERLSQRRAKNVEKYLNERGYLKTALTETRWLGESVPVTECSNALKRAELIACLQRDRRVEVEMDYYPEGQIPPTQR